MRGKNSIVGLQTLLIAFLISLLASVFVRAAYAEDTVESIFDEVAPSSILIVPVVNNSLDVDAPNFMLSTLTIPLAARGYYVFPVNTTKIVLEQEGFYEPDMVHAEDPTALAGLFGADAILYVTINRWDAQYAVLSTEVTVAFSYRMVSSAGQQMWMANKTMRYTPNRSNGSGNPLVDILASAVLAAIDNTVPRYMSLTEKANDAVIRRGHPKIPTGPYYGKKW